MPDPSKFVEDVKEVLSDHGVWIIQQNYLLTTMELNAVDNFCHEHLEYYTLLSMENLLERFGLEVNEVQLSMVNGGSIRTVVSRKGMFPVDSSVAEQRQIELDFGVQNLQPYIDFADNVMTELNKLRNMVIDWASDGKTVAILAASTRGATIWQSAELDERYISYAIERNPAKVGKYFTAIGVPIISEEEFRTKQPDYAIIGPWFFSDEIIEREKEYLQNGGVLIKPLPKVELITV
jgi:NDP-4-keto-2,6-dideoxyhexose 3-C-methyltransferase